MSDKELQRETDEILSLERKKQAKVEAEAEAAPKEPRTYTVKSGDSLSKIAKEVYGNAGRWREIFEANTDQIENPSLIRPGQKLIIPEDEPAEPELKAEPPAEPAEPKPKAERPFRDDRYEAT